MTRFYFSSSSLLGLPFYVTEYLPTGPGPDRGQGQLLNGIPSRVIPAKAGIHVVIKAFLDSRLRGNDPILAVVVIKNVNSIFKR